MRVRVPGPRAKAILATLAVLVLVATQALGAEQSTENTFGPCPGDEFLTYQLSYIQADRVAALLKAMRYPVLEFSAARGEPAIFNRVLTVPPDSTLQCDETKQPRPLIMTLVDSEKTSIVSGANSAPGAAAGNLGGQSLGSVTAGVPQQRLLIVWNEKSRGALRKLLALLHEQIDVAARQILIEALVIELDRQDIEDLGITFQGTKDGQTASIQQSAGFFPFFFQFKRPSAKSILDLTVSLNALVNDGRAEILSQPSVLVLDGRQARIRVGDKLPYTELAAGRGDLRRQVVSSTKYLDVGITLNLRPRASDDESHITMQVETNISSPAGLQSVTAEGAVIAPPIAAREVQTIVRVANDTPFIIAGLIRSTLDNNVARVPGLSRVPVLKHLFTNRQSKTTRREVIVVITPHIIQADDRSFSYTIAKDSDLFDNFNLTLFQNTYRLRREDVFDLSFIKESRFVDRMKQAVDAAAVELAVEAPEDGSPPLPSDESLLRESRPLLIERIRRVQQVRDRSEDSAERIPESFLTVLQGGVPGEDILVRRMLFELIAKRKFEGERFGSLVREIIYFKQGFWKPTQKKAAAGSGQARSDLKAPKGEQTAAIERRRCPAPIGNDRPLAKTPKEALEKGASLFEPEALDSRIAQLDKGTCETLVLCFETASTTASLPFDPPSAVVSSRLLRTDAEFERDLRALNGAPGTRARNLAILLNKCYAKKAEREFEAWREALGDRATKETRSTTDMLKDVLVLKRVLDLNPTLPLTLDGFHPGIEIVFPSREDLLNRTHVVDRRTAQLFYEALDYYGAFIRAFQQAHDTLTPMLAARSGSGDSMAPAAQEPADQPEDQITEAFSDVVASLPRERPARGPQVELVIRYGPSERKRLPADRLASRHAPTTASADSVRPRAPSASPP